MGNSEKLVRGRPQTDDESGPRTVDEAERAKQNDREIIRALTKDLPRREPTLEEREIFARHRQRIASGERLLSHEEMLARRASK